MSERRVDSAAQACSGSYRPGCRRPCRLRRPRGDRRRVGWIAAGAGPSVDNLRNPKVEDFDRAVKGDLDVGRLQIAMDPPCSWAASSAPAICRAIGERIGNLSGPSAGDPQASALHELQDQRVVGQPTSSKP